MSIVKKKRVSKKLKSSWRKHAKFGDVEEFLEEQRLEERLGPVATLTNDELFKVDTTSSSEFLLSPKERRLLRFQQPPKCFTLLRSFTKVPDPIVKRNRVRSKEERKNSLIKKKEEERRSKGILRHREAQAIADRKLYEVKKQNKTKRGDFNLNLWEQDEPAGIEKDEWAAEQTKKHNLAGVGALKKTVRKAVQQKTSVLPAVEPPHPGMSYNPSFDDHQNLLKKVADSEVKIIKKEKHLLRVTRNMFSKVTAEQRDSAWLEEMAQGLSQPDSGDETDDDYKTVNPPVKNSKKTLKQRRKQKEQRELGLMQKSAKLQKKKISDIHQLKVLKKNIDRTEKQAAILREKRKKVKALKSREAKRLGSHKFEEAELDFNMAPDISGNLRNIKKEGNLLADRFNSLQKRNILQPTVRIHRKKSKIKRFSRSGHKDNWIETVAR